jgi:hypothetical protein
MTAELATGLQSLTFQVVAEQGCQMVSFRTKNPSLGKFRRAQDWKMLIYVTASWNILQTFGIFYDHLVHLCSFGTFFPVLVSCTKKNLATLLQSAYSKAAFGKNFCTNF